jgi:hypothetical protein
MNSLFQPLEATRLRANYAPKTGINQSNYQAACRTREHAVHVSAAIEFWKIVTASKEPQFREVMLAVARRLKVE